MKTIMHVVEGLHLIAQHGGECVVAEHDEIFAGHEVKAMSKDARDALEAHGWERDESLNCWRRSVG